MFALSMKSKKGRHGILEMKDRNTGVRSNKMSRNMVEGELEMGWATHLQSNQSCWKHLDSGKPYCHDKQKQSKAHIRKEKKWTDYLMSRNVLREDS